MFRISKDTPAYYLTSVAKDRLPVFRTTVKNIHQNPVRAGLVKCAEEYRWSSVRYWARTEREDEPLIMDLDKVAWRVSEAKPRSNLKRGRGSESRTLSARDAPKPLIGSEPSF